MRGNIRYHRGAWRLQVSTGSGAKRQFVTRTVHGADDKAGRKTAELALAKLIVEVETAHRSDELVTVTDLMARFVEHRSLRWSPSHAAAMPGHIARVTKLLGDMRLDRLTVEQVDRAYDAMLADGLSSNTVRRSHYALHAALNDAVRWRLIAHNPASHANLPPLRRRRNRAPADDALFTMIDAIKDKDFLTVVVLASAVGARRGEYATLRWSDFDLDAGKVTIARGVSAGVERQTKTDNERILDLDQGTVDALEAHLERHQAAARACGVELAGDAFVFSPDPAGRRPFRADSFTQRWCRLRDKVAAKHPEVAAIRLNDLRHYHATVLSAAGMSLPDIGYRLGHASTATTAIYAHPRAEAGQRAAAIIGAKLHERG